MKLNILLPVLAAVGLTSAQRPTSYPPHYFDQPIDHFPHSARYAPHTKDTFKQRFFFDSTYYKPGGPVFLYLSGETSGESRFSNLETGTIADNAYFAQRVSFPGINVDVSAPGTPWILYGGSLAGAQTAFSVKTYPHILYGGIASSATTKALLEYPQWYDPIQRLGPSDCIASINAIVDNFDALVATKNEKAIQEFKAIFGLESLSDIRDFAATIAFPLGGPMNYPTNTWQELNWYPAYTTDDFFNFCSNVTNIFAPESITSVDYALAKYTNGEPWTNLGNYANYFKNVLLPLCDGVEINSSACFSTQNATNWAIPANDGSRSYLYSTCTEQGAYQVAPITGPSLISTVLKVDYTQDWCNWAFPPGKYNKIPHTPDLSRYNVYGGWDVTANRLAHIDGATDVWLDLCYHSHLAPPRYSSDLHPEYLIAGGGHHWDSYGILDINAEPQFIQQAHLWEIRTVQKWLKSFNATGGKF
ncbi:hypothetical protein OIDMADRAFT_100781 [Oidiodendron maius Zn]|uniref:Peptidase S28 n=1 Tax=Oidiodendron maius (strain Zn) TaxID=913774 RepID=A0A0C3HUG1_OIDMZ|nr:hypothetical protein OIDMADRAFT_100781 [Oidiodendron maius Zn]